MNTPQSGVPLILLLVKKSSFTFSLPFYDIVRRFVPVGRPTEFPPHKARLGASHLVSPSLPSLWKMTMRRGLPEAAWEGPTTASFRSISRRRSRRHLSTVFGHRPVFSHDVCFRSPCFLPLQKEIKKHILRAALKAGK